MARRADITQPRIWIQIAIVEAAAGMSQLLQVMSENGHPWMVEFGLKFVTGLFDPITCR